MAESSPNRVQNTMGKGEIASYEQFFPFPPVFKRLELQTCINKGLIRKWLTLAQNSAIFL